MSSPVVRGRDHIASAPLFSPPTTSASLDAKCTEASGASGASSKGVNAESCAKVPEAAEEGDQTRTEPSACATASLPFAPGATARSTAALLPAIGATTTTPAGASAPAARSSAIVVGSTAFGSTSTANTPSP